jgi:hypothetical protein
MRGRCHPHVQKATRPFRTQIARDFSTCEAFSAKKRQDAPAKPASDADVKASQNLAVKPRTGPCCKTSYSYLLNPAPFS